MLSNLTGKGGAALQTILLGQPQFRRMLASPDLDQLRQRVLASYHLGPLSREETRAYIEHRLTTAGWTGTPHWDESSFDAIFRHSDGIPRRINRLCSRVLMHGALEETSEITGVMVETTAEELDQDLKGLEGEDLAPTPVKAVEERARPVEHERDRDRPSDRDELRDESRALSRLTYRVEELEDRLGRRERLFQRLADIFSDSR